jgi:hypothetical protein
LIRLKIRIIGKHLCAALNSEFHKTWNKGVSIRLRILLKIQFVPLT